MLITVMNTSAQKKRYTLPLPEEERCMEFYSQQQVTPGEELSITLPPGEAEAYVLAQ